MARPVVVVLNGEDAGRQALTRELQGRWGADYRIVSSASPEEALARTSVPLLRPRCADLGLAGYLGFYRA